MTRHVYGFPRKQEQNDFQFNRILDFRLYGVLQQHSVNKPILVFCATRKGTLTMLMLNAESNSRVFRRNDNG